MKKLVSAAIILTLSLTTITFAGEDPAEPVKTGFTGVFSDSAVDVDDDGYFEYLVISAEVHITSPGRYYLEGNLAFDLDYLVSNRPNWLSTAPINSMGFDCDTGLVTLELPFSGEDIFRNAIDGIYTAGLSLYKDTAGPSAGAARNGLIGKEYLGYARTETAYYDHNNFREYDGEIPALGIMNLEIEQTIDTSGNGLFDMLDATVSIGTVEPGLFNVKANLMSGSVRLATFMQLISLRPGPNPAKLSFPGNWIHRCGQDGHFTIDISLTETRGKRFARNRFTTEGNYNHLDFEPGAAVQGGPAMLIGN